MWPVSQPEYTTMFLNSTMLRLYIFLQRSLSPPPTLSRTRAISVSVSVGVWEKECVYECVYDCVCVCVFVCECVCFKCTRKNALALCALNIINHQHFIAKVKNIHFCSSKNENNINNITLRWSRNIKIINSSFGYQNLNIYIYIYIYTRFIQDSFYEA